MKKLLLTMFVLFMVPLFLFAEAPNYQVVMKNLTRPSAGELQFDVYIRAVAPTVSFELTAFQGGYWIDDAVRGSNSFASTSAGIISGTSELNAATAPTSYNATATFNSPSGLRRIIKTAAKLAQPGFGSIITTSWTRIYRLRVWLTSGSFSEVAPNYWFDTTSYKCYLAYNNGGISVGDNAPGVWNTKFSSELGNDPLPVEIAKIWATTNGREITIKWQTATEKDLNHFEVERLVVDKTGKITGEWTKLAEVSAAGNSNSPKDYTFVDKKLNTGEYAYRLKSVDNDGSFKYTDAVRSKVDKPAFTDLQQNYPNSFNPTTKIEYQLANPSKVTLQLYNVTGQFIANLIQEENEAGYYLYYFDANRINNGIASGVYLYRMIADDRVTGETFTKTKKMLFLK